MAITNYPNGVGGTLGGAWALCEPILMSGNIWYVSSVNGVNAATPAGQNREKPLATLAQALTNAADNDVIVILGDHNETITSNIDITKRVLIVGEGSAAGVPTAKLTCGFSGVMLTLHTAGIELSNLKFPACAVASTFARLTTSQTDCALTGCYFECGALDDAETLNLNGADRFTLRDCTFISVATSLSAQAFCAIRTDNALADLTVDGLVLSGGTVGFSNTTGCSAWDTAASVITRLNAKNVSLLLGADMALNASSTGRLNVQLATGGSRVRW